MTYDGSKSDEFSKQNSSVNEDCSNECTAETCLFDSGETEVSKKIFFHYQPIVNITDGTILGGEALLRAEHPDGSHKVPAEFLNRLYYAKRSKIIAFDKYVLRENLNFLKKIHHAGQKKRVSINISGISFLHFDESPVNYILGKLQKIQSEHLIDFVDLEIVEWINFKVDDDVVRRVQECRDAGIGICFDDAGTGMIGLDTFVRLPFSCIKVDRFFVSRMIDNPKAFFTVKGLVESAKTLGLRIVAEGVETLEQLDAIRDLGVEYVQGFHFYCPMDGKAFINTCENNEE